MKPYLTPQWRRNQVVQALWEYFLRFEEWGQPPRGKSDDDLKAVPQVFESRIRKLLNLDRAIVLESESERTAARWVFFETDNEGTGSEELFGDFHVFLLGIALDLWQLAGWKQSEVIYFLRHTKASLRKRYQTQLGKNLAAWVSDGMRMDIDHGDYPESASYINKSGIPFADFACYMVINRSEFCELNPHHTPSRTPTSIRGKGMIFKPHFVDGVQGLAEFLRGSPTTLRAATFLEITDMAYGLPKLLARIEPIGRGRPKQE